MEKFFPKHTSPATVAVVATYVDPQVQGTLLPYLRTRAEGRTTGISEEQAGDTLFDDRALALHRYAHPINGPSHTLAHLSKRFQHSLHFKYRKLKL